MKMKQIATLLMVLMLGSWPVLAQDAPEAQPDAQPDAVAPADDAAEAPADEAAEAPAEEPKKDLPVDGATAYYLSLHGKRACTYEDGLRAVLILIEGRNYVRTFDEMRLALMEHNVIPDDWSYAADSPITVGMIAYMLVETLEIDGGISLRVMGNSRRYATRECSWLGLIKTGQQRAYVQGPELLGILQRAKKHMSQN